MNSDDFRHPDNWGGGPTYGLTMGWFEPNDRQFRRAMRALWQAPALQGPWNSPEDFPELSTLPDALDRESGHRAYGLLRLDDGNKVGCRVFAILREQEATGYGAVADWLTVVLMRGMQERAFDFDYGEPFRENNPWLGQLDSAFLTIAELVYVAAPFDLAVIDFEGIFPFDDNAQSNIAAQLATGGLLLPPAAMAFVEAREDWIARPSGLFWLPSREP